MIFKISKIYGVFYRLLLWKQEKRGWGVWWNRAVILNQLFRQDLFEVVTFEQRPRGAHVSHERIWRNNKGKERSNGTAGTKTPWRACIWCVQVTAARLEIGDRTVGPVRGTGCEVPQAVQGQLCSSLALCDFGIFSAWRGALLKGFRAGWQGDPTWALTASSRSGCCHYYEGKERKQETS